MVVGVGQGGISFTTLGIDVGMALAEGSLHPDRRLSGTNGLTPRFSRGDDGSGTKSRCGSSMWPRPSVHISGSCGIIYNRTAQGLTAGGNSERSRSRREE